MRNDFESNYLAHHGILGQKHGQRNGPPYPLSRGDHSAAEKAAGWMKSLKDKHAVKVKKKKQQAALEKARIAKAKKAEEEKRAKEYEEKKQQILRSGKASEVAKYKGQMTNSELNDALNRIRWEDQLDDYAKKEIVDGHEKINKMMAKVKDYTEWYDTSKKVYNTIAEVYNTFSGEDAKKMKRLGGGGDNKKKDKNKNK